MPSAFWNFITTTLLTLICASTLYIAYRRAIRPILSRYNIPLQALPSLLTRRSRGWMDTRYRQVSNQSDQTDGFFDDDDDDSDNESESENGLESEMNRRQRRARRLSRDLEEGFKDDSDEEEGDNRSAAARPEGSEIPGSLNIITPQPLDENRSRFPATRI